MPEEKLYWSFNMILAGSLMVLGSKRPKKLKRKNRFKLSREFTVWGLFIYSCSIVIIKHTHQCRDYLLKENKLCKKGLSYLWWREIVTGLVGSIKMVEVKLCQNHEREGVPQASYNTKNSKWWIKCRTIFHKCLTLLMSTSGNEDYRADKYKVHLR